MRQYLGLTVLILCVIGLTAIATTSGASDTKEKKAEAVVTDGSKVKLHYTLRVDGKVIESSRGKEPFVFEVGSKQVIPGFEKAVKGMKVGEKKSFKVEPEDAYGQRRKEAIQEVPKERMPKGLEIKPGMTLYAQGPGGHPIPVKVVEVKKDRVVVDFNHPLAGKTLNFDVEILEIN